jgi:eukaryotic-like serine/threonine-protein kinase
MNSFYKKHPIIVNLFGILLVLVLFAVMSVQILSSYTQHGQTITVPDLSGKKMADVQRLLDSRKLEYKIIDSSYSAKVKPLTVIDQNPKPGSKVKEERTVYLTINAKTPPKVKMPDLRDASLKQAQIELESYGLRVGKLTYKPDLALNAVLDQQVRGKSIAPGSMIAKGTRIDLVVGDGLGQTDIDVPNLVGLTLDEAKFVLEGVGLNLGAVVPDNTVGTSQNDAVVYRQVPENDPGNKIKQGEPVDVFITEDQSRIGRNEP